MRFPRFVIGAALLGLVGWTSPQAAPAPVHYLAVSTDSSGVLVYQLPGYKLIATLNVQIPAGVAVLNGKLYVANDLYVINQASTVVEYDAKTFAYIATLTDSSFNTGCIQGMGVVGGPIPRLFVAGECQSLIAIYSPSGGIWQALRDESIAPSDVVTFNGRLYTLNFGSSSDVVAYDLMTYKHVKGFTDPAGSYSNGIDAGYNLFFITNIGGTVDALHATDYSLAYTISGNGLQSPVGVAHGGNSIFVANQGSPNSLLTFQASNGALQHSLTLPSPPEYVAYF